VRPTLLRDGIDSRELELVRLNGERFWCEVTLVLQDPSHTSPGFVATLNDITRRKRAEAEKAELEEKLRQSQRMEAIGTLAGGVAHDFNNLLTVIAGYSDAVMRSLSPGDPNRSKLEQVTHASQRAADLTRQLLAFSRKQVLQPKVLDLNTIIANLSRMLKRLIGEDIELSTHLDPNLSRIQADPGHVEQVLINLAVNARDAMPRGGKLAIQTHDVSLSPSLAAEKQIEPGHYICVSVSDTGEGIAPEILDRIFEPFFTTKAPGRGTGLGLSTVYGIVKQSNGHIEVLSQLGLGTTMQIYLPRAMEIPDEDRAPIGNGCAAKAKATVLLVEDETMVRELAVELLRSQGFTVMEAADGLEALDVIAQHPDTIDLVLSDVVMPRMSGAELAKRLLAQHPRLKIIFMSGYPNEAVACHGLDANKMLLLRKPFTCDELLQAVGSALQHPASVL